MITTSVKEHLHQAIDLLDEEDANTMLNFITRFVVTDDVATTEDLRVIEQGRRNYENGEYLSLAEYDKKRKSAQ